eukprot:8431490-Karenia_brevis.AAC.1
MEAGSCLGLFHQTASDFGEGRKNMASRKSRTRIDQNYLVQLLYDSIDRVLADRHDDDPNMYSFQPTLRTHVNVSPEKQVPQFSTRSLR